MLINSPVKFIVGGKPVDGNGNSLLVEDFIGRIDKEIAKLQAEKESRLQQLVKEQPELANEIGEKFGGAEVHFGANGEAREDKFDYRESLKKLREAGVVFTGNPSKAWVIEQLSVLDNGE